MIYDPPIQARESQTASLHPRTSPDTHCAMNIIIIAIHIIINETKQHKLVFIIFFS